MLKNNKKTVCFSKFDLINNLIEDKAVVEHKCASAVIEQILLDTMLPANSQARQITENCLYSQHGSIESTLFVLFANNSAGVNWKSVYDNFLPLVQFAKNQTLISNSIIRGNEEELYHTCQQIKSVIVKLKEEKCEESDILLLNQLLEELEKSPSLCHIFNFYVVIIRNWDVLKDWSITYRLLADLVKLEKNWRNYPETKLELLEIVKKISTDW